MDFSRPEHWSGQPFPSLGDLPNPGIKPRYPTFQADSIHIYFCFLRNTDRIIEESCPGEALVPHPVFFSRCVNNISILFLGFPGGSDGEESACNAGDLSQSLGWEDPLEKGMVTHSNILAWRIPWIEELGRLQSMGWQRVGHD